MGLRRIHGELTLLGIKVTPSTVREIIKQHGIQPAPQRDRQTARNLVMDLHDASATVKHLIRDHDNKFTRAFEAVFESEGIGIVTTGIRVPRMNSIMERCSAPLRPVAEPLTEPDQLNIRRRDRLGGILHEYQPAA
ncbi:hypothetical protein [Actinomadura sp. HBU206391]|uniref:hypothetical protein n=1 Tax=Actinomadura sp. HBU206391 TaxID=2731692 RepID=UPI001C9C99E4|nr:hypothetical protein [Actinomadura sp. HBU206391]